MLELTDKNVIDTVVNGNFLLMFCTDWCPICRWVEDALKLLATKEYDHFQIAKLHLNNSPKSFKHFGIIGIPTVLAVKDGVVLHGWAGLTDADTYQQIVSRIFD